MAHGASGGPRVWHLMSCAASDTTKYSVRNESQRELQGVVTTKIVLWLQSLTQLGDSPACIRSSACYSDNGTCLTTSRTPSAMKGLGTYKLSIILNGTRRRCCSKRRKWQNPKLDARQK